jgi:hypothetical protein
MDRSSNPQLRVFISYSHDSPGHKEWVKALADSLEEIHELHVKWDGYDLDALIDKNLYMEEGVCDSDFIIIIATMKYKQKADTRSGGVGIETRLSAAQHWEKLESLSTSNIIVLAREKDSIPNYLKNQLYIDFSDDENFVISRGKLLDQLRGNKLISRPAKTQSLVGDVYSYSFNRVEDLIRISHPSRTCLVGKDKGKNFSGSNRIKYEIWEALSPAKNYYLALGENINLSQTVEHAIGQLDCLQIRPGELTILSARASGSGWVVAKLFREHGFETKLHEYSYKDFIWKYCIDESFKLRNRPSPVRYYTPQSLIYSLDGDATEHTDSAHEYFVSRLQEATATIGHLVVAQGGMGKTSLCLTVGKELLSRAADIHSSVVLIQAEPIKSYFAEHGQFNRTIRSIYDLYEVYSRYHSPEDVLGQNIFELAFLGGNLIVIIDGLDEFVSLFPDTFYLSSFLESLAQFHSELGSSSVLMTTRDNDLIEYSHLAALRIEKHHLLGFSHANCLSFLKRRFRLYPDKDQIVGRVLDKIEALKLKDNDERIIPFFVDIAATVEEDSLSASEASKFDIVEDDTPYPSNNDLTDHIIHSVLRREEQRHQLDISVNEVMDILCILVADNSKRWLKSQMKDLTELLYDARGKQIASKIALNPLLSQEGEFIELRYEFLRAP